MKARFKILSILLVIVTALCLFSNVQAAQKDMWAAVYADTGKRGADGKPELTRLTSGVTFSVLAINTDTAETLYVRGSSTSLTNPVTTTNYAADTVCNDMVAFRVDPTDSSADRYVDLIVVDTSGGYTAFVEDFDEYTHTIVIDERPGIMHSGMIWFTSVSGTETDTGVDFETDTLVTCVQPEIVTVSAGGTVDIGLLSTETSGDADGFIDGVSTTTAGFVLTTLTTSGALMDDGTNFDPDGHVITASNAVSITHSGDQSTAAGYIHYTFIRLR